MRFDYLITDLSHTTIRRGCFKAHEVQIRTSLMPEGHYNFILCKTAKRCSSPPSGNRLAGRRITPSCCVILIKNKTQQNLNKAIIFVFFVKYFTHFVVNKIRCIRSFTPASRDLSLIHWLPAISLWASTCHKLGSRFRFHGIG